MGALGNCVVESGLDPKARGHGKAQRCSSRTAHGTAPKEERTDGGLGGLDTWGGRTEPHS